MSEVSGGNFAGAIQSANTADELIDGEELGNQLIDFDEFGNQLIDGDGDSEIRDDGDREILDDAGRDLDDVIGETREREDPDTGDAGFQEQLAALEQSFNTVMSQNLEMRKLENRKGVELAAAKKSVNPK